MIKHIAVCDRCGKESKCLGPLTPIGWEELSGEARPFKIVGCGCLLCPACAKKHAEFMKGGGV